MGSYCFLPTYIKGATCTVSGTTGVIIVFTNADQPAGTFSVVTNTKLSGTTTSIVSSINSMTSGSVYIDKSITNPYTWTYSTSNKLLTSYQFFAQTGGDTISTSTGSQTGGFLASRGLAFAIAPNTAWSKTAGSATSVVVNLPYSTADVQLLTSYIDTTLFAATAIYDLTTCTLIDGCVLLATSNTYAFASNSITISTGTAIPTSTTKYLIFNVGTGVTDNALPYVKSNLATFYETWATATTGGVTDIYNTIISVFLKDAGTDVISTPLCTDILFGIPLYSLFTAIDMEIAFGTTYVLEISVVGAEGLVSTGVAAGEQIPYAGGVTGETITYSVVTSAEAITAVALGEDVVAGAVLTIMGLGSLAKGGTVETYIIWDNSWASTGSQSISTRLYYNVAANDVDYELYSKTDLWTATAVTGATLATFTAA
jgi:hypothetical protein